MPRTLMLCAASVSLAAIIGCGDSTETTTTSGDELSEYLKENPELAKEEEGEPVDPADLDE
ncbi:hypothetical protein FYK55_01240 [Roseiconus nitratireducens]|uniref:Secreted protein n=1 Tax=Roseiconus nitratireducens TaxID=2605748 RepID=A0A5M6DLE2_9BACT|nr:hypothetical protein [Roseiconus nitratireducens]KAA5547072.1 hypothetical protein FYK55_01240 [Roseiconus nitratireducens]